jgi:hypothetical protein
MLSPPMLLARVGVFFHSSSEPIPTYTVCLKKYNHLVFLTYNLLSPVVVSSQFNTEYVITPYY